MRTKPLMAVGIPAGDDELIAGREESAVTAGAATGPGPTENSSLKAAETARLARRISLLCRSLPERDTFFWTVRFFLATALETFFSLESARLLSGCPNSPGTLQRHYSNRLVGGVNCFEQIRRLVGPAIGANSSKTATCKRRALTTEWGEIMTIIVVLLIGYTVLSLLYWGWMGYGAIQLSRALWAGGAAE